MSGATETAQDEADQGDAVPVSQPPFTEHALYRHFSAEGELLYIGISLNAMARTAQHRDASSWYPLSVRMEMQRFKSRSELLFAERAAIRKEKPKFNRRHNRPDVDDIEEAFNPFSKHVSMKQISIMALRRSVALTYSENDLRHKLGISCAELDEYIARGAIRFYLVNGGWTRKLNARKKVRRFTGWSVLNLLDIMEAEA